MSNVKEIEFAVEQAVLDIGVKIVFAVIEGIDNTSVSPEWMETRTETISRLLEEYSDIDYHADPILEGFHILHDHAGVKRRKNTPASENLIRLLKKHGITEVCAALRYRPEAVMKSLGDGNRLGFPADRTE